MDLLSKFQTKFHHPFAQNKIKLLLRMYHTMGIDTNMNFDYEVDAKHGLNKLLVVEFKEFVELKMFNC
jgi:hypothetical protein